LLKYYFKSLSVVLCCAYSGALNMRFIYLAIFLSLVAGTAYAAENTPEGTVRKLYASYGLGAGGSARGFDEKEAKELLDKALAQLFLKAAKAGAIEADFFVQGQDFSLTKPIDIDRVDARGSVATVYATLSQNDVRSNGKPYIRTNRFRFLVAKRSDGWRITDAFTKRDSVSAEWKADLKLVGKN
jgi:hypothetical protein